MIQLVPHDPISALKKKYIVVDHQLYTNLLGEIAGNNVLMGEDLFIKMFLLFFLKILSSLVTLNHATQMETVQKCLM